LQEQLKHARSSTKISVVVTCLKASSSLFFFHQPFPQKVVFRGIFTEKLPSPEKMDEKSTHIGTNVLYVV
jgi:hypothetical protein